VRTKKELATVLDLKAEQQLLGCSDEKCVVDVAANLGVDGIMTGSIAKIGAGLAINVKVIGAVDGKTLTAKSMRAKDVGALLDWFGTISPQMAYEMQSALGRETVAAPIVVEQTQPVPEVTASATTATTHEVEWGGRWFPARVLKKRNDGFTLIHYEGYADSWDEWVAPARLRKVGEKIVDKEFVEVNWKGTWYKARIREKKRDGSALIHYEGYGDNWDEWVTPDRMRPLEN
jgi:hypothetical protein